jgi:hypothetical protein
MSRRESPAPAAMNDATGGATRRRAAGEIAAVILTGGVFLVFENVLHLKLPFIIACIVLWAAYIIRRALREPAVLKGWGIRLDNVKPAALACLAFLLPAAAGLLAYRYLRGWRPLPATSLVLFALYPVWGLIQEFVVQGLVAGNLERLGVSRVVIIAAVAVIFGLAHVPDWPLVAITMGAGAFWTVIFLRTRNLIPLAIIHGWLGTLAYYWILEKDPWKEMWKEMMP